MKIPRRTRQEEEKRKKRRKRREVLHYSCWDGKEV